ncbi:DUF7093 family protein [Halobellus rarus]|uniref:Oxidoreductase n=1 Tax=Halobellus rarus TaxID=1126237 RepID=A0ABD6CNM7_9EURY|nr:hypothetical protein [Halobellus rarus]
MGLKCRLLGHAYGDSEVERSREEQGDEVVVTIREMQVCERCGAEQVVSQNKEVTAIRSPAEVGLDGPSATDEGDPSTVGGAQASPSQTEATDGPTATPAEPGPQGEESGGQTDEDAPAGASAPAGAGPDSADVGPASETAGAPQATAGGDATGGEHDDGRDPGAQGGSSGDDPAGASAEPIEEAESDGWETGSDDWDDVDADPDADDAVILDDEVTERDEAQWPEETDADPTQHATAAEDDVPAVGDPTAEDATTADAGPATEDDEAVTNDAEIIDGDEDDDAPPERGHGEWPERDDAPSADRWPDHDGEDEGYDATVEANEDVELSGNGLTPEVNGRADLDESGERSVQGVAVERERPADGRSDSDPDASDEGFIRAGESTTLESDVPDDHIEFYCPNCGHARTAGASSMRAGDICPECKQGYIAEREQ